MSGCRIAVVAGGLKQTVGSFLRRWSKLVRAAGCVLALLLGNSGVAQATPWVTGDVVTYYQDQWGEPTTAAGVILNQYMATVLPNGIEIGIPGNGGFSLILTDQFA